MRFLKTRYFWTSKSLWLGLSMLLSACQTVKLPQLDWTEFKDTPQNLKEYPPATEAPDTPTDIRSAEEWDQAARDIIRRSQEIKAGAVHGEPAMSQGKADEYFEILKSSVQAYKHDDPPQ